MKLRLLLPVLLMLAGMNVAAWHPRPRRPIIRVPWQTVAAGGAAAGTVIAAYKISDGSEQGMKTVAREKPEVFAEHLSAFPRTLSWAALVLLVGGGYFLWRQYQNKEKSNQTERKNE